MRYVASASLVVLLASSAAHATVYVWRDREGSLVMTNDAGELPDAPNGPLITYATTESSPSPAAAAGDDDGAAPPSAEGARPALRPPAAEVAAASARQTDPSSANGAPRTLGEAKAQHLIAAATTPTNRATVEPRALLDIAARAEPPQVIVSIVAPSAGPLSTSDGATTLGNGGSRGMNGRTRLGGGASPPSIANGAATGMR